MPAPGEDFPHGFSSRDGWDEYRRLVLSELERANREIREIHEILNELHRRELGDIYNEIGAIKVKIATLGKELQLKSGVWGAVAAIVVALAVALLRWQLK